MTGTPLLVKSIDRIELTQRMPWIALLGFGLLFPCVVWAVTELTDFPSSWALLFQIVFGLGGLACASFALVLRRTEPILYWRFREPAISIPRLTLHLKVSELHRLVTHTRSCEDGEGGTYPVRALEMIGAGGDTRTIYLTRSASELDGCLKAFRDEVLSFELQ
jgi:hypothetical protein